MIKIQFECGGCDATETAHLQRHFHSVTGRSWGIGHYTYDTPQDVAPDGWIAFDPYTGCTYCPACWKSIEAGVETAGAETE